MNESNELLICGPHHEGDEIIFTAEALAFLRDLTSTFGHRVDELLVQRQERQRAYDDGQKPDFLPQTEKIRTSDWKVARLPADLLKRTVEITGPVERKMIINALNSGADVFMADFEDSNAPTWENVVRGQINLYDAVRKTIAYTHPKTGKDYRLKDTVATLMVRPRGWHLSEKHITLNGQAVPATLVDFGLYFFHNAQALLQSNSGPYFYLPKLQSHLEARLYNDIFVHAQRALRLPVGTIKATVLIETLPAAFEMDEILYELRDHSAGLNCGRWDYIFSFIKTFRNDAERVIPDRGEVGMTQPFMRAYTQLLIRSCHRRGVHAIGGMAAQIPIKGDSEANEAALEKVRADKLREVQDGHDGTWVAHPALVAIARTAFDEHMTGANQLHRLREDVVVSRDDLIAVPSGVRTNAGLRHNIRVGIQYLEAWLRGNGCVPLYHLMEDAATAEICRTQIWQWLRHQTCTDDGETVTTTRIERAVDEELANIREEIGAERFEAGLFGKARDLFTALTNDTSQFTEFLTLPAYEQLTERL